jgi:hypothetical protein
MNIARKIILIIPIVLLLGCGFAQYAKIKVVNNSGKVVNDIKIVYSTDNGNNEINISELATNKEMSSEVQLAPFSFGIGGGVYVSRIKFSYRINDITYDVKNDKNAIKADDGSYYHNIGLSDGRELIIRIYDDYYEVE